MNPRTRLLRAGRTAALATAAVTLAACGSTAAVSSPRAGAGAESAAHPSATRGPTTTRRPPPPSSTARPATTTSSPATSSVGTTARAAPGLVSGRVTVVGDSVTIDAAPALEAVIAHCQVVASVGEQWTTGLSELEQLRSEGQLGSMVVVALGTNGPVTSGQFAEMMSALSGVSRVVIVTNHAPVAWEQENNAMFRQEVPRYPNARLADWNALVSAHPGWLYPDGTHMPIGGTGAQAFAGLVKAAL